jgi:3-oxoacyl-[acyl-carrier protein] reductase
MPIQLSLADKVALITGGSRGIGAATVGMFVAAGAQVVFNYHRARRESEQLVSELGPQQCAAVACDLSGPESAGGLVEATVKKFGRLDILVANHGVWAETDTPVDQMTPAQWRHTLSINLDAVFSLTKHTVAQMKKQGRSRGVAGHIVFLSSTAGQRGEAFHCDYAASKGALISMVKGLSTELAGDGIYVNCVAPGWVDTDMSASVLHDTKTGGKILAGIPLGRAASPDEIAGPILFLCTPYASFITGEIFNVNGGAVLAG